MILTVLRGDALAKLHELPDESVQCCVTSPPYWGLRDYGVSGQIGLEETPEAYAVKLVEVFREVRRVLRKDGTLWLNLGDSYASKKAFESFRGSATATLNREYQGRIAYRGNGIKAKDLIGIPWRVAFALQADGWYLRSDIIWHKPNPMPESVTDRPTKAHEYIFLLSKSGRYFYDAEAIEEASQCDRMRGPALHGDLVSTNGNDGLCRRPLAETRNKRSVWTVPTAPYAEAHFATYPPNLIKPCILAGSQPGDVVLDPFAGSGTTGMVAIELGRKTVLIELNPEYIHLIEQRCSVTEGLAWLPRPIVDERSFDIRRTRRYRELLNSL
jgi:DNA modification methylase